jgi:hypothetical protein
VSSMCFNQQGDLLLVGYSNGHLILWDVPKANVIRTLEKEHPVAVVHTLFLGQDVPGARNFKAITSDSKGLTLLHTFTMVPVLRRYTVNTTVRSLHYSLLLYAREVYFYVSLIYWESLYR